MVRGQDGFATPFLYDSFIHYFTPVYPDAIQAGMPVPQNRGYRRPGTEYETVFMKRC